MKDSNTKELGTVYLVGAGPGDPGLITVRGLELLESAEVVVHDRLVDQRLVARAPGDAEVIDVGKVPGEGGGRQADINTLLVSRAKAGKRVVRLKGGDPFVFGRGGEEAEALVEAEVPFDVVPGVTSATAAPAYAGIPLTHRKLASSFTVVTGSEAPDKRDSAVDWGVLARAGGTLVVLMGFDSLPSIATTLVREGRAADTPVALVQWGSEPYQRTVVGTLAGIAEKAEQAGLTPPVVAVIGDVVDLREKLRWFDNRPLYGKRVLVTRSRDQASALSALLSREGAQPLEVPTIEVRPLRDYGELDDALSALHEYAWVVFTSTNTVEVVFQRLARLGRDARAFQGARVAAIGPATAASLLERGIVADFVPEGYVSESVVEGMKHLDIAGKRILLPRPDIQRETLRKGLAALGATVHDVVVYNTVLPEQSASHLTEILSDGIDVATFTSSSTVKNLHALLKGDLAALGGAKIACIGPITANSATEKGLKVDILPREYTVSGLVEALKEHYSQEGSSHG